MLYLITKRTNGPVELKAHDRDKRATRVLIPRDGKSFGLDGMGFGSRCLAEAILEDHLGDTLEAELALEEFMRYFLAEEDGETVETKIHDHEIDDWIDQLRDISGWV